MRKEEFCEIISGIDDSYIKEAHSPAKVKNRGWVKWGTAAACICLMAVGAVKLLPYDDWNGHQADDPNWSLTHLQTAQLSEIESVCGTDLLINKIPLPGEYHSEYILEITENGSFYDPQDWTDLTVRISYGESVTDKNADNIFCFISFDGNTEPINTSLWRNDVTVEVNGCKVAYSEKTSEEFAAENGVTLGEKQEYHAWATFTHNGYSYYLTTNSNDREFFMSVLDHMLGE